MRAKLHRQPQPQCVIAATNKGANTVKMYEESQLPYPLRGAQRWGRGGGKPPLERGGQTEVLAEGTRNKTKAKKERGPKTKTKRENAKTHNEAWKNSCTQQDIQDINSDAKQKRKRRHRHSRVEPKIATTQVKTGTTGLYHTRGVRLTAPLPTNTDYFLSEQVCFRFGES